MINPIYKEISGKNIILVGNSVEILEYKYGDVIESYDVIVRFGRGVPTPDLVQAIGRRTDIWVTGLLRQNYAKFFPKAFKLFNRNRIYIDKKLPKDRLPDYEYMEMFSDKELLEMYKEFGYVDGDKYEKRPSAGFIALLYFTRVANDWKSLTLIGFDFFAKTYDYKIGGAKPTSWHKPKALINQHPHNPSKERDYALKLESDSIIKWIKLSNFTTEDIISGRGEVSER